jgi:hypothetical protein
MNWLRQIIGSPHANAVQAPVPRTPMDIPSGSAGLPSTPPRDMKLVKALKSDHRKVLALHECIGRLAAERRYLEIPAQLVALRTRLETHILTENVRLYAFLEHLFQGDAGRLDELAEYRADTNAVLLAVLKFIKHHRRTTFDESRWLAFADEHRRVGAMLARLVTREENGLYQLYPLA